MVGREKNKLTGTFPFLGKKANTSCLNIRFLFCYKKVNGWVGKRKTLYNCVV